MAHNPSKAYFISDLHLGASYFSNPRQAEQRVVAFLDSIKEDAAEIYLLGDVLDYWFEYRYAVPRGYVRFFGKLAELSDKGIAITWLIGNHDIWIFDYLPGELGVKVVDGSIVKQIMGKSFYLSHGDNVGERPLSFRIIRSVFRNRLCQQLYASIHPRWTIPFALGWSKSSRHKDIVTPPYLGKDKEPLMQFAETHAQSHTDIDYYVFGHRHVLVKEQLSQGAQAVILGEWISMFSYAVFDGNELKLCKYEPKNML